MANCINKKTKFYNTLSKVHNLSDKKIIDLNLKLESKEFKDWYNGKKDSFGYPILYNDLFIVNDNGASFSIMNLLNDKFFTEREKVIGELNSLDKLYQTLEDLSIGLQKKISHFKGTSYADNLQFLLNQLKELNNVDSLKALTLHTNFVKKTIQQFEDRLYKYDATDTSDFDVIKEKERLDDFVNFLLEAEQFLSTFETISNLDTFKNITIGTTNFNYNILINNLKDAEHKVVDLKKRIIKEMEKLAREKFQSLSTNPEIIAGTLDFLGATEDASFMQRWFDSVADTHNPFFAAIVKHYKRTMYNAKRDIKNLQEEWDEFIEKTGLKNAADFDKLIDKNTGKWLEQFDTEKYYEELRHHKTKLKVLELQGKKYSIFDEENSYYEFSIEYEKVYKEYKAWKKVSQIRTKIGDKTLIKPSNKYLNKSFIFLTAQEQKNLFFIKEFLKKLIAHTEYEGISLATGETTLKGSTIIHAGFIPTFEKNPTKKELDKYKEEIITEGGDIVKFLKLPHLNKLNQQDLLEVTDEMTGAEKADILEKNEEIRKQNKIAHAAALNYDIPAIVKEFIRTSTEHKHKKKIENDIRLAASVMKRMKIVDTSAKGEPVLDKLKGIFTGETEKHLIDMKGSNLHKMFKDFIEGIYYDEFELDEGKLTEITNRALNFSSFIGIGFKITTAINNSLVGGLTNRIEAQGKQYFTVKDLRFGTRVYATSILDFINNRNTKKYNSLVGALVDEFDIIQSQAELLGKPDGLKESLLMKTKMLKDTAFFFQTIGEHQIQNQILLSMLNSHRVVDGKIMSFFDYFKQFDLAPAIKKMKAEGKTNEEIKKFIDENKGLKEEKEKEFTTYRKVIDEYELVNGKAKLKTDSSLTNEVLADFTEKVKGVNQKLHGAYTTEDAALVQRYALGRMAMQFRKWLPNAWNRRFGAKFGKSFWNERREEYNEGMYVTFGKYIASPFIKSYKEYKAQQQNTAIAVIKSLFKGLKDFFRDAKINWHSLNELEKANVRRTAAEVSLMVAIYVIGSLAAGDDDEEKNKAQYYTIWEADRLFGEFTTFTPLGVIREGSRLTKNPFYIFKSFDNIITLLGDVLLYPFQDEEERYFGTGVYHGRGKIAIHALKNIPILNEKVLYDYIGENNERYGYFK